MSQKGYTMYFSKHEYIHARCIHMRKIVYLIFGIHKYLSLYMYRYTDKVTKMYKYMHMYKHPQYTLTYAHLGLHIYINAHIYIQHTYE